MMLSQRSENPRFLLALGNSRINSYCSLAGYVVLLYDYLLTVEKEYKYIWPAPWNPGKCLYIAARYLALLDGVIALYVHFAPPTVLPNTCTLLYGLSGGLIILGMIISELVLVFRTWAIWGQRRKLAIFLLVLFAVLSIPGGVLEFRWASVTHFGPSPNPQLISCWMSKSPAGPLFLDFISIIVFESVILALTIYKVVTLYGTTYHLSVAMRGHTNLVETLYLDGIVYYIYLLGISIINIAFLARSVNSSPSFILMQRDLHSVFSTRILLNLREASCRNYIVRTPDRGELAGDEDRTPSLFDTYTPQSTQSFLPKSHCKNARQG